MFKLEFGIVHRDCVVNELSRALPEIRIISAGGFITSPTEADEVLIIDSSSDADIDSFMNFLQNSPKIAEADLMKRLPDKAFVRILCSAGPETGYCSQAVYKNRCFNLGKEVQIGGVEQWTVGARQRLQAENLVKDLQEMGDLKYHTITEVSWNALIDEKAS